MIETVLQTEGLTKYYSRTVAVDHMDLRIPRGCICGFVGRNGSGKTTAIKCMLMLGLLHPTAGSSMLLGCDSQELTSHIRQRIGHVTEGHRLIRWMSIGSLEKFQRAFFPGQWDEKFFAEMIDYFGLSRKQKMKQLSNGQRAQVSLALALAPHPELLIMDDPTLGLDAAIRRQFLEGMIQLIMHKGTQFFSQAIYLPMSRESQTESSLSTRPSYADCSLDEFRKSVKKVQVTFAESVPADIDIEGLLHCRRDDETLELVLVGTEDEKISNWAESAGAADWQIVKMNLEDQFIEYTAPAGQEQPFRWEDN